MSPQAIDLDVAEGGDWVAARKKRLFPGTFTRSRNG
jgi:hypothetical protein